MSLIGTLLPIIKHLLPLLNWGLAKNFALPKINKAIRSQIGRDVAEIEDYHIDITKRKADLKIYLHGDHQSIQIKLKSYEIIHEEPLAINIIDIKSDRKWVEGILKKFVLGKHSIQDPKLQDVIRKLLA